EVHYCTAIINQLAARLDIAAKADRFADTSILPADANIEACYEQIAEQIARPVLLMRLAEQCQATFASVLPQQSNEQGEFPYDIDALQNALDVVQGEYGAGFSLNSFVEPAIAPNSYRLLRDPALLIAEMLKSLPQYGQAESLGNLGESTTELWHWGGFYWTTSYGIAEPLSCSDLQTVQMQREPTTGLSPILTPAQQQQMALQVINYAYATQLQALPVACLQDRKVMQAFSEHMSLPALQGYLTRHEQALFQNSELRVIANLLYLQRAESPDNYSPFILTLLGRNLSSLADFLLQLCQADDAIPPVDEWSERKTSFYHRLLHLSANRGDYSAFLHDVAENHPQLVCSDALYQIALGYLNLSLSAKQPDLSLEYLQHPGVVASMIRQWGMPRVVAYLQQHQSSLFEPMKEMDRTIIFNLLALPGAYYSESDIHMLAQCIEKKSPNLPALLRQLICYGGQLPEIPMFLSRGLAILLLRNQQLQRPMAEMEFSALSAAQSQYLSQVLATAIEESRTQPQTLSQTDASWLRSGDDVILLLSHLSTSQRVDYLLAHREILRYFAGKEGMLQLCSCLCTEQSTEDAQRILDLLSTGDTPLQELFRGMSEYYPEREWLSQVAYSGNERAIEIQDLVWESDSVPELK
ncbi:MAG: hypothetical protein ACRC5A_15615, partial [Enterobacteriaceae bacterium]